MNLRQQVADATSIGPTTTDTETDAEEDDDGTAAGGSDKGKVRNEKLSGKKNAATGEMSQHGGFGRRLMARAEEIASGKFYMRFHII